MKYVLLALALTGCADKLVATDNTRPDAGADTSGPFATTANEDGSYTTVVDAQSTDTWLHGDFETRTAMDETGPWDLRFQRFHLSANGGVSGSRGVEVIPLRDVEFDAIVAAPSTGWITDEADGPDDNAEPDYAFETEANRWYDYDADAHVLTPAPIVWVVRTADSSSVIKLEIERYYDDVGTAAVFTLHWAPL